MKSMKNGQKMFLIAEKKRPDALNATQKKPQHFRKCGFWKNQEKPHKIPNFNKNGQKMVIFAFSASRRFFWAIKNIFSPFFILFIIRGDPSDLEGVKIYQHWK